MLLLGRCSDRQPARDQLVVGRANTKPVDEPATIGAELTIEATAELRAAGGLIYRFRICAADNELVTGRLTIATPPA